MPEINSATATPLSSLKDGQAIAVLRYEVEGDKGFLITEDSVYVIDLDLPADHELKKGGHFNIFFDPPEGQNRKVKRVYWICSLNASKG